MTDTCPTCKQELPVTTDIETLRHHIVTQVATQRSHATRRNEWTTEQRAAKKEGWWMDDVACERYTRQNNLRALKWERLARRPRRPHQGSPRWP